MATTPLGRLPNLNHKGPSPSVGGDGGSSTDNERKKIGSRDQSREKRQPQKYLEDKKASTVALQAGELDPPTGTNNFEDDNEWDIGIGDLIIDLDADIEKTRDEKLSSGTGMASPASTNQIQIQNQNSGLTSNGTSGQTPSSNLNNSGVTPKMAVEHSATVDKGLKMKIKRTKPGTKTSEAKHEIVKSNEINGQDGNSSSSSTSSTSSIPPLNTELQGKKTQTLGNSTIPKRGSSGHRREKAREKEKPLTQPKPEMNGRQNHILNTTAASTLASSATTTTTTSATSCTSSLTSSSPNSTSSSAIAAVAGSGSNQPQAPTPAATAPQQQQPQGPPPSSRTGFPVNGPGTTASAAAPVPPASPASATAAAGLAAKPEQTKVAAVPGPHCIAEEDLDGAASPPPAKKFKPCPKSELKDMSDVCVGTSVGTITEPECLGPCEPGTSVTLEGIVWHETEGGVLVVNVTWRGKTYVGTLLDCTRHDWAPPRFCDSPTSDLDARTPKGRGKRGRAAANATPGNDLSNFTETRSSVHSKLRNGGKGRRGATQSSPAASPSPASTSVVTATATTSSFVPPRPDPAAKRKFRGPEDEEKSKRRAPPPTPPSGSPPASPILLECPEPNCSKKYKHINGLKYHQSHAHGSADDEDTKEGITSMSENDESNIEAPSPATPVKSPEKLEASSTPARVTSPAALPSETPPPAPRVPSPNGESLATTTTSATSSITTTTTTVLTDKSIVKPGVLRFGEGEQGPVQAAPPRQSVQQPQPVQSSNLNPPSPNPRLSQSPRPVLSPHPTAIIPQPLNIPQPPQSSQLQIPIQTTIAPPQQCLSNPQPSHLQSSQPSHLQSPQQSLPVHQHPSVSHTVQAPVQPLPQNSQLQTQSTQLQTQSTQLQTQSTQPPLQSLQPQALLTGQQVLQNLANQLPPQNLQTGASGAAQPHLQPYSNVTLHTKVPQFKVKPTAALMPEQDKKDPRASKQGYKKKSRKSPGGSPHPLEAPLIDSSREEVQSPAYSDISDDAAPLLEVENPDKMKVQEKEKPPQMPQFSMYPYYGQSQYLVPVQEKGQGQDVKIDLPKEKPLNVPQMPSMSLQITEKEKNKDLAQQHYYASYGSYMSPGYYQQPLSQPQVQEHEDQKVSKIKQEPHSLKEKQHENHQILKESIEMKSQMNPYYHGAQSQRAPPTSSGQIQDDRRYYLYGEQRRKEEAGKQRQESKPPPPSPKHQVKEKSQEMRKNEEKIKQEGVKPTMETQGPPPPPTSQYAYIHPGYMPPQHYGTLSFDPGHGVYRGLSPMLVPGPYTGNPYIHQMPRYHGAAEDLSRPPAGKALDLLQHHANQYYSAHKIHELQERALKSPTPKGSSASASPSSVGGPTPTRPPSGPPTCVPPGPPQSQSQQSSGKSQAVGQPGPPGQPQQQPGPGEAPGAVGSNLGKDNRTSSSPPPPPRLVHAHHTHLDIGYSIMNGQYPAPYGGKPLVRP